MDQTSSVDKKTREKHFQVLLWFLFTCFILLLGYSLFLAIERDRSKSAETIMLEQKLKDAKLGDSISSRLVYFRDKRTKTELCFAAKPEMYPGSSDYKYNVIGPVPCDSVRQLLLN